MQPSRNRMLSRTYDDNDDDDAAVASDDDGDHDYGDEYA